jgi:hypothetical protein
MLNIDSDNLLADSRFSEKAIQDIGYCFAKVLGSLMDEIV